MTRPPSDVGEQLAEWGKVALVETRGRLSGKSVTAAVGFIEEPDGSLLVAAGSERSDWARNLAADPRCRATVGERTRAYVAEVADDADRSRALVELVLKYGTPAERLGHGPVFRLRPVQPDPQIRVEP